METQNTQTEIDRKADKLLADIRKGRATLSPLKNPQNVKPHEQEARAKVMEYIGSISPELAVKNFRELRISEQNEVFTKIVSDFQRKHIIELGSIDHLYAWPKGKKSFALVDGSVGQRTMHIINNGMIDEFYKIKPPIKKEAHPRIESTIAAASPRIFER